ncbi:hypothetical protein BJY52DRAFT_1352059 [Lactarius psammicola]|nr:hypothetical protein BJY52DRAFT_1352059 [Lactarius psammicola]
MSTVPPHSASGADSTPTYGPHDIPEDGETEKRPDQRYGNPTSVHVLPDYVLLEIFDWCRTDRGRGGFREHTDLEWQLVHVCQRWRYLVFASPSRLNLELLCTHGTPVRKGLGCWPVFPIIVDYDDVSPKDEDNVIAALERFPREVFLRGISFPTQALPTHLFAANGLITLEILEIPPTDYISPEAMLTGLAGLTMLKTLTIEFRYPIPRANRRLPVPATPVVRLPSLSSFKFRGFCEYLEDLVAQIDAPRVTCCDIWYFSQPMYQASQLSRFLARSDYLKPPWLSRALLEFVESWVSIELDVGDEQAQGEHSLRDLHLNLRIISEGIVREALHLVQLLHQVSASLFNVVDLTVRGPQSCGGQWVAGGAGFRGEPLLPPPPGRQDSIDHIEWLALLRPFTAVNTLHLRGELSGNLVNALEWVKGEVIALPALHVLHLEDPSISVERFISARQNVGRPVVINLRLPDPDPDSDGEAGEDPEEFSE